MAPVPPNILITGAAGLAGSHLVDLALSRAPASKIHCLVKTHTSNLKHLFGEPRVILHQVDLNDRKTLTDLLQVIQPGFIFHLAAQSFVAPAIADPSATITNNAKGTINLFEAVLAAGLLKTRILNAGSSDQYGFIMPEDLPVKENTPFRPGNPYAVSKITQEMLGYQYFRSAGLQVVATRAFNHLGPRQSENLAAAAFARQIALAEAGIISPVIKVGNLEASRDFADVRDIVKGYWLSLANKNCLAGEAYNLCSGQPINMAEVLDKLRQISKLSLKVKADPSKLRPSDLPVLYGDYTRFKAATGWEPAIPLETSLLDLLEYWRAKVKEEEKDIYGSGKVGTTFPLP